MRKTIILGGRAGSAELREWASRELKGFLGTAADDMPPNRIIEVPMLMDAVTGSALVKGQLLPFRSLPDWAQEGFVDGRFYLRQGVGELEAWAQRSEAILIVVPGAEIIGAHLDRASGNPFQQIHSIYWAIMPETIAGVLDKIRTALAELIGELIVATPANSIPTAEQATQAVNVAVHGAKARVTVTTAQTTGGAAQVNSVTDDDREPSWWTGSRRIGAFIVGLATVVAAVAAVLVLV